MRASAVVLGFACAIGAQSALEASPGPDEIRRFVEDWQAKRVTKALPVSDMKDAACARDKLVEALGGSLGKVVGYKAGLTAKPTQERFNASAPVAGVLLESMILKDGASVPATFGGRPVWEGDMLLVVKDEGINQAKTPEEGSVTSPACGPSSSCPTSRSRRGRSSTARS